MSYYCIDPIEPYEPSDESCGQITRPGGISHILLFLELPSNPSDGSEIETMISEKKAFFVPNVKIGITDPSPIEVERMISCSTPTVANYDREFTWMDDDVTAATITFYNSINAARGVELAGALLYECENDRATFIDRRISVQGGRIVPDDNTDLQHFSFVAKWRSVGDPNIVDWPTFS